MIGALGWIGARARWVLVLGAFVGLAAPEVATALRPALPVFVALVYALAMLRIDPSEIWRGLASPREAARTAGLVAAMLILSPVAAFWLASFCGLGADFERVLVYTFAAPPIASAAAMCLIVGFSGAKALRLTVLASLAMPFTGPAVASALIGTELDLSPVVLGARMAAMIGAGAVAALAVRRILGAELIARRAIALDGVAAIAFLMFILPLFDGAREAISAAPMRTAAFLALSCFIVLGAIAVALKAPGEKAENGALGAVWGTRSVAIFLAALPPDPAFALYVALYQFPMAAIPLVFGGAMARFGARSSRKP